jgi:hypothetical protein
MSPLVGFTIGGLAPVLLFASVLWYRDASGWIRRLYFSWSVVGLAWAVLGIVRSYNLVHLTRGSWVIARYVQTLLAGISLGLITAALLSADFWKVNRHYRLWYGLTHRSSRPLTGDKISK